MTKQKKRVKTAWAVKTKGGSLLQTRGWYADGWEPVYQQTVYNIYARRRDALRHVGVVKRVVKVEIREL